MEFITTPIASAPSTAPRTPRLTLPRTSPAMYALYWNPMNWNSSTAHMRAKLEMCQSTPPPVVSSPLECAEATSEDCVTPKLARRLRVNAPWLNTIMPNTNMSTADPRASAARPVTIRWKRLVGWMTSQKIRPRTTSMLRNPGQFLMMPPDVNHVLAF